MLLLCAGTSASAYKPELIADLIRKAEAGQQEGWLLRRHRVAER